MVLNMPKILLKTVLKIQMEILYLPIRFLNSFYSILFEKNKALGKSDRYVQVTSDSEQALSCSKSVQVNEDSDHGFACNKSIQVDADSEHGSSCNKCVQVNTDLEQELSCNKSVQANPDLKQELSCNKYVQANPDLEQKRSCSKCVQADSDKKQTSLQVVKYFEQESSCERSVQTTLDSQQDLSCDKSVQVTLDSPQEQSCDKSVQATPDLLQELSPTKGTGSENNRDNTPDAENSCYTEEEPLVFKTGADYIRYSKVVQARTLKMIDELSNICTYTPPANETVEALKSLKSLQCKKEKLHHELNSSTKDILIETAPVVKQALRDINSKEQTIGEIKNMLERSKNHRLKNHRLSPNPFNRETSKDTLNGQEVLSLSMDVLQNMVDIIVQEISVLKLRLSSTNNKIEEVLKSSSNLNEEVSKINERFNRLVTLSSKITDLQNQLCNGNKFLKEVEADRNEMQLKLHALARLIKEEEDYLDDVSCESGYDEIEMRALSPYKNYDI